MNRLPNGETGSSCSDSTITMKLGIEPKESV